MLLRRSVERPGTGGRHATGRVGTTLQRVRVDVNPPRPTLVADRCRPRPVAYRWWPMFPIRSCAAMLPGAMDALHSTNALDRSYRTRHGHSRLQRPLGSGRRRRSHRSVRRHRSGPRADPLDRRRRPVAVPPDRRRGRFRTVPAPGDRRSRRGRRVFHREDDGRPAGGGADGLRGSLGVPVSGKPHRLPLTRRLRENQTAVRSQGDRLPGVRPADAACSTEQRRTTAVAVRLPFAVDADTDLSVTTSTQCSNRFGPRRDGGRRDRPLTAWRAGDRPVAPTV